MNWFDAILIAIILIFMAFGIKKGFMFSVIDLFGVFVNFVIALFLCQPMHNLLKFMGMESAISNGLHSRYAALGNSFTTDLIAYKDNGNVTDFVNDAFNNCSLGSFGKKLFNGTINNNLSTKLQNSTASSVTLADIMSKSLAQFITVITAFIISFALIYVVLLLLRVISKALQKSNFIKVFDKIFGACFGIVKGLMFWVIVFAVLSFFSDNGILSTMLHYINQSAIGSWLRTSVNNFMIEYIDIKQFLIDLLQEL
jgi:uncharacterized membrane protein required for colicin V production